MPGASGGLLARPYRFAATSGSGHYPVQSVTRYVLKRSLPREFPYSLIGAAALAALILLLPLAGTTPRPPANARAVAFALAAYALVLIPMPLLLHGFLLAARNHATPRLLALGALSGALGLPFALLAGPEDLLGRGSGVLVLVALCVANLSRILAAACVGISLARYVRSAGVVLIVAAAAVASDLFSVFAGPTKALLRDDSPVLDVLVLVFPTFGSALGFGLGVSDFIFLALFAAASRFLGLRYAASLLGVCLAAFLALTAGLLLERPLPALPFVAVAFVLVNADLIVARIARRR